eukprot:c3066_g1_i1.p1 GENE.c3066_g1_i1~~c3066_g1_i1.p1  ORF type:complete len:242 (-),score=63.78 c3066_g1_i1:149-832(-)
MADTKKHKGDESTPSTPFMDELQGIQQEIEGLTNESLQELVEVEKKYTLLKRPKYDLRSKVIQKIPNFWLIALENHGQLSTYLTADGDRDALTYLTDLNVEDDVKSGYKVTLTFKTNPYFTDTTITKEVKFEGEGDEEVTIPPTIHWKPGKDLTAPPATKGSKREASDGSFFQVFCAEGAAIADSIREELWPNPVKYFLGENSDAEEGFEYGEEDDEEEEAEEAEEN